MPTYIYKCISCEHRFEEVQRITAPAEAECPNCESDQCERVITAGSFHLKGSGWYASDYRPKQLEGAK